MRFKQQILILLAISFSTLYAQTPSDSRSAKEYYRACVQESKAKNYIEAFENIKLAIQKDPNNPSYSLYAGWLALHHLKSPKEALTYLKRTEELDPNKKMLRQNLARTYRILKEWEKAAVNYKLAAEEYKTKPNKEAYYTFLAGEMYFKADAIEKSIPLLNEGWKSAGGKYKKYMRSKYPTMVYQSARKSLANLKLNQAKQYFDLVDNFVYQENLSETEMINYCSATFYSIDYQKIIDQYNANQPKRNGVKISFLSILPESVKNSPKAQEEFKITQKLFSFLIWNLSEGNMDCLFDWVYLDKEKYQLVFNRLSRRKPATVNLNQTAKTLLPALENEGINLVDFDTLIFFFDDTLFNRSRSSSSVLYQKDFPTLLGDIEKLGMISVAMKQAYTEGNYLHEYFHLLENQYGISPRHGFSPTYGYKANIRKAFPEWRGEGQFSYYKYHFQNSFAPKGYDKAKHH